MYDELSLLPGMEPTLTLSTTNLYPTLCHGVQCKETRQAARCSLVMPELSQKKTRTIENMKSNALTRIPMGPYKAKPNRSP